MSEKSVKEEIDYLAESYDSYVENAKILGFGYYTLTEYVEESRRPFCYAEYALDKNRPCMLLADQPHTKHSNGKDTWE